MVAGKIRLEKVLKNFQSAKNSQGLYMLLLKFQLTFPKFVNCYRSKIPYFLPDIPLNHFKTLPQQSKDMMQTNLLLIGFSIFLGVLLLPFINYSPFSKICYPPNTARRKDVIALQSSEINGHYLKHTCFGKYLHFFFVFYKFF